MTTVYLNGQFMPIEQAKISPLDRGFLFGDGIYEVIPAYQGRLIGFGLHVKRLQRSLASIDLKLDWTEQQWRTVCEQLLAEHQGESAGIYLHITRGADVKRNHTYSDGLTPTIFAYAFDIPQSQPADRLKVSGQKVISELDLRWERCHIKTTALLGHVMHYQQSKNANADETILYNAEGMVTEACSCNIFVVKDQQVITPKLSHQLLAGITRQILLEALRDEQSIDVLERDISIDEVRQADELWLTSSGREIAPVTELDGKIIGSGQVGEVWQQAKRIYDLAKFSY